MTRDSKHERQERLATALKRNLQRRKIASKDKPKKMRPFPQETEEGSSEGS